ncbi:MAG: amino acid adenylation domain-containing protein, partial [Acidobacteriota bacterium]
MASIWSEVLHIDTPSVTASFFELGGHSLLATRLAARLRERFGVELTLRQLFDQPTIESLAGLLPDRPSVGPDAEPESTAAIDAARRAGVLSFAQRRLWTVAQLDPESTAYNMPFALRLGGALDRRALTRALDAITHEVDSEAALEAALLAEASTPFDLEQEVLRLRLFVAPEAAAAASRMTPVLLFHVHHIAFDGWSFGLLQHELASFHDAFAVEPDRDTDSVLPAPAVQYADYAARQSVELDADRLATWIEPWRRRLAGLDPLELPLDRPRTPQPKRTVTTYRRRLPKTLDRGARELARQQDRTLFTTLLTAFAVTVQAITGRDDFAIGAPEAGRRRTDVEDLMGFFVDMLVLRLDLGGDPTLDALMAHVHEIVIEARDHSEVPFDALVEALSPDRQLGRNPFFDLAFQVVEMAPPGQPAAGRAVSRLELTELPVALGHAKLDLILDVEDDGEQLELVTHFADELFDEATIVRWLDRFERCLGAWIAKPTSRLSQLDLRSAADRAVVETSNRRANPTDPTDYPGAVALFDQARRQIARDADKPAVLHRDAVVTWGELIGRAEHIGRHLITLGVRPGDVVGLGAERGPRWVEGMLGIAAAGAAYVPLDVAYPADRLRFMVEDSGMRVLLGETDSIDRLPAVDGVTIVDLDRPTPADDTIRLPRVDGDFPAYMIFTSGSSGRPKGTIVPQRAVTRLVVDTRHFDHRPDDVVAQVVSPSFDPSVWEFWGALLHGATLAVIDREALVSPAALDADFTRHGVTVAVLSTAVFHQVARQSPATIARLRVALFGGERCDPQAIRSAADAIRTSGTCMVNGYGPTECTVMATGQPITEVADDAVSIPIGPPTTRNTVRVVDALGREVGVGVPGELWIGGPGVADGYHRRPSLTAAVFVPDEQASRPGARCYRTGDLVRWLPDGSLDFLGRIDQQVKLRGYRIEPGEIETALARHPQVDDTAVLVREDQPNNPRLVAYATPEPGGRWPEPEALRQFLADDLPEFMVPSIVLVLDRLPLTANGKIDRRLLPAPEVDASHHVAPRNDTEATLAEIWRELLGVSDPSIEADFFALGGHSLLATSLVAAVRDRLGVEVPVRWVFEQPTIEALAARMAATDRTPSFVAPALVRRPDEKARALTFGQERLWFLDRLMSRSAVYNIPFAQRLRGPLDVRSLDRTLVELVRRHDALRSRFPEHDGQPMLVIDPPPDSVLTAPLETSAVPDIERRERSEAWLLDDATEPFDLEAGPVFRARLLRLDDDDHVLALTIHHIVSDGASTEIVAREISRLYATFQTDREAPSPLDEPSIRLSDVAAWQRRWLVGEPLAHLTTFWRQELAGLQPTELPADRPRPALFDHAGAERRLTLEPELVDRGRAMARALKVTPFQLYLASFLVVLQR